MESGSDWGLREVKVQILTPTGLFTVWVLPVSPSNHPDPRSLPTLSPCHRVGQDCLRTSSPTPTPPRRDKPRPV